jgi:hypothetical protein
MLGENLLEYSTAEVRFLRETQPTGKEEATKKRSALARKEK